MAQSPSETLELHRAVVGRDLWAALEAAQYARAIAHDDPRTEAEEAQMRDFFDFFAESAEHWEGKSAVDQAMALERFADRLAALDALDLSVYWAVVQGRFRTPEGEPVELPVAVLSVAQGDAPTLTVDLPGTVESA